MGLKTEFGDVVFVELWPDSDPYSKLKIRAVIVAEPNPYHDGCWIDNTWDFEWSKAYENYLKHNPGFGPLTEIEVDQNAVYWVAKEFQNFIKVGNGYIVKGGVEPARIETPLRQLTLLQLRRIIGKPILDVLNDAEHTSYGAVHCSECDDYLNGDDWEPCEHAVWCDNCGGWNFECDCEVA